MKHLIVNTFKPGFFGVMFTKLLKRLERSKPNEALAWAKKNVRMTTEEFCEKIDPTLLRNVKNDIAAMELNARTKIEKLGLDLGGGGNYLLLQFLVRKFRPACVVETGVAAGWSSLAILQALEKNNLGTLYSSDFPYFRLEDPEKYVGFLVQDDVLKKRWRLDTRGDAAALPEISELLQATKIDLFHYDSDKSYSGRKFAIKTLSRNLSSDSIIIFDDIQDNLHFKDFVETNAHTFCVLEFQGKYVGVVGL